MKQYTVEITDRALNNTVTRVLYSASDISKRLLDN